MSVRLTCCLQLLLLVQSLLWSAVQMQCTASDKDVTDAFKSYKITPDELLGTPKKLLRVAFDNVELCLGKEITTIQTASRPRILSNAEHGKNYTLMEFDPDVPQPVNLFLHWLVVNIPGDQLTDSTAGDELASYVLATPPPGSGTHRYIFVLFEQRNNLQGDLVNKIKTTIERIGFNVKDFVEKHGFENIAAGDFCGCCDDD